MFLEPTGVQAILQAEPCTVQLDMKIGRTPCQFLTDFSTVQTNEFTHHKASGLSGRQFVQTGLENLPKLAILQLLFRISPF